MQSLIIFVAAFGVALAAPQGFLQNTPEVEAATLNFINEYNRLARLAHEAPDIHIYTDDNRLQRVDAAPAHHRQAVNPLQGASVYSFSANLGGNQQFQPHQFQSFSQVPQPVVRPVPQVRRQQVHHQQTFAPRVQHQQAFVQRPVVEEAPVPRWTGPMADTVPAGVNGLPVQVTATPEVEAARNAHFSVLVDAYQRAAATRQQHALG